MGRLWQAVIRIRWLLGVLFTAAMTAVLLVVMFSFMGEDSRELAARVDANAQAVYEEVVVNRAAARCLYADIIDAQREIMNAMEIPPSRWPARVDLEGIECTGLPSADGATP